MTTKFRQKYAKIAHILVVYKMWRQVFGIGEFKYSNSNLNFL